MHASHLIWQPLVESSNLIWTLFNHLELVTFWFHWCKVYIENYKDSYINKIPAFRHKSPFASSHSIAAIYTLREGLFLQYVINSWFPGMPWFLWTFFSFDDLIAALRGGPRTLRHFVLLLYAVLGAGRQVAELVVVLLASPLPCCLVRYVTAVVVSHP